MALTSQGQLASASYTAQGWQGCKRWTILPDLDFERLLASGLGFPMAAPRTLEQPTGYCYRKYLALLRSLLVTLLVS